MLFLLAIRCFFIKSSYRKSLNTEGLSFISLSSMVKMQTPEGLEVVKWGAEETGEAEEVKSASLEIMTHFYRRKEFSWCNEFSVFCIHKPGKHHSSIKISHWGCAFVCACQKIIGQVEHFQKGIQLKVGCWHWFQETCAVHFLSTVDPCVLSQVNLPRWGKCGHINEWNWSN